MSIALRHKLNNFARKIGVPIVLDDAVLLNALESTKVVATKAIAEHGGVPPMMFVEGINLGSLQVQQRHMTIDQATITTPEEQQTLWGKLGGVCALDLPNQPKLMPRYVIVMGTAIYAPRVEGETRPVQEREHTQRCVSLSVGSIDGRIGASILPVEVKDGRIRIPPDATWSETQLGDHLDPTPNLGQRGLFAAFWLGYGEWRLEQHPARRSEVHQWN